MKESDDQPGYCRLCLIFSNSLFPAESLEFEPFIQRLAQEADPNVRICSICTYSLRFVEKFIKMCRKSEEIYQKIKLKHSPPQILLEHAFDGPVKEGLVAALDWTSFVLEEQHRDLEQSIAGGMEEINFFKQEIEEDFPGQEEEELEEIEAKIELFQCDECHSNFNTSSMLQRHIKKHHSTKEEKEIEELLFGCTVPSCSFTFPSESKLRRHLKRVHFIHEENQFACDLCKKLFPSKTRLQYHMNMHLDYCPFVCDVEGCGKTFRNPSRLRNHKQEFHFKVIRMHCEICGKGCRTKAAYNLHILGHSDPTLPCEICGKLLTNKKTLANHLKVHTGEKKYKCTFENCTKAFTKCSGLQVHMRCHTKEKPYECKECGQKFTYNVVLKKHMQRDHNIAVEFMKKENIHSMPGKNSVISSNLGKIKI